MTTATYTTDRGVVREIVSLAGPLMYPPRRHSSAWHTECSCKWECLACGWVSPFGYPRRDCPECGDEPTNTMFSDQMEMICLEGCGHIGDLDQGYDNCDAYNHLCYAINGGICAACDGPVAIRIKHPDNPDVLTPMEVPV